MITHAHRRPTASSLLLAGQLWRGVIHMRTAAVRRLHHHVHAGRDQRNHARVVPFGHPVSRHVLIVATSTTPLRVGVHDLRRALPLFPKMTGRDVRRDARAHPTLAVVRLLQPDLRPMHFVGIDGMPSGWPIREQFATWNAIISVSAFSRALVPDLPLQHDRLLAPLSGGSPATLARALDRVAVSSPPPVFNFDEIRPWGAGRTSTAFPERARVFKEHKPRRCPRGRRGGAPPPTAMKRIS